MVKLKAEKTEFETIAMGHKFKAVGQGKLDKEKDEHFWCQFCGGRGEKYVVIERDDGRRFLVGRTCLGRVGLEYVHSLPEATIKKSEMVKRVAPKKPATPKKVVRKTGTIPAEKPAPEPKVKKVTEKEVKEKEASDTEMDELFDEVK